MRYEIWAGSVWCVNEEGEAFEVTDPQEQISALIVLVERLQDVVKNEIRGD